MLLPAANDNWQKHVIGGILCAMMFSLWVFPLIFGWAYRKEDETTK